MPTDAAGASDVIRLLRLLDTRVRREGFVAESGMQGADAAEAIMATAHRLYRVIARSALRECGDRAPLSTLTKEEAGKRVSERRKGEGACVIGWLGDLGSDAFDVF